MLMAMLVVAQCDPGDFRFAMLYRENDGINRVGFD